MKRKALLDKASESLRRLHVWEEHRKACRKCKSYGMHGGLAEYFKHCPEGGRLYRDWWDYEA